MKAPASSDLRAGQLDVSLIRTPPGVRFRYNNGGYVIPGAVIEELTGLPYEEALRRRIFVPLGMTASRGWVGWGQRCPRPPRAINDAEGRSSMPERDPDQAFSAGGLYSTTTDIARWEKIFYSDGILISESRALLSFAPANAYSYGQRFDRRCIGPGREEGVLTDLEPEEIQLNAFGYELLGKKRFQGALAVFTFAVEQFPSSWNAYDGLAEAQAALGRNEEAVKNYRKSLVLSPANKNASEQIERLGKDS